MRPRPLSNPPVRYRETEIEYLEEAPALVSVQVLEDQSRTILSRNDSPDLGFSWSVNPYRGCMHACAYCYARPYHEYLDLGAGTDFDTKIVIKPEAPRLLREAFDKPSWRGETVVFSGVTDCYQPLESTYQLTRGCLEVCAAYQNPVGIITKAPLVERDLDVLAQLAERARVHVRVSIPFWEPELARAIEPYVATPQRRIRTIERLAAAGISVGVNVAPVIPGLNDQEVPKVLEAARRAGAEQAGYTLLRLPGPVEAVFTERLRAALPLRADKVLRRIRETRGGERMNDGRFGARMRGEGEYADFIGQLFQRTARRLGFNAQDEGAPQEAEATTFRRPAVEAPPQRQLSLF